MIQAGLTSVTFRKLSPRQIVDLVQQAGLPAIEWGGDIHVPHGDLKAAREVFQMTSDAGLSAPSYGSYLILGAESQPEFSAVLDTAVELHAQTIRVWAGEKGPAEADEAYWNAIIDESRRIGDMAEAASLTISFEFHRGTLTETGASAVKLLKSINHSAVKTYWQPLVGVDREHNLEELRAVLPWLTNIHAFYWMPDFTQRPLDEGSSDWHSYLELVSQNGGDRFAMIEFVKDDSPDAFLEDAAALKSWLVSV